MQVLLSQNELLHADKDAALRSLIRSATTPRPLRKNPPSVVLGTLSLAGLSIGLSCCVTAMRTPLRHLYRKRGPSRLSIGPSIPSSAEL